FIETLATKAGSIPSGGSQVQELPPMRRLGVRIYFGRVRQPAPRAPHHERQYLCWTQSGHAPRGSRGSCLAWSGGCSALRSSARAKSSLSNVSAPLLFSCMSLAPPGRKWFSHDSYTPAARGSSTLCRESHSYV